MSKERMSRLNFITEVSNTVRDVMDRLLEQMKAEYPDLLDGDYDYLLRNPTSQILKIRNDAKELYNMMDLIYFQKAGHWWNEEEDE